MSHLIFWLTLLTVKISRTAQLPYFVSYVGQIGPRWGYSRNAILLSNLGVPGYSNHPYNVLNFAFWISSSNAGAIATATDCWQNIATYISDTTLRQTLTGKTNPSSAELRQAIKDIYIANGIKIFVAAFGANDHPQSAGKNAVTVGTNLANYAIQYLYDGVDIDWEEGYLFNSAGDGEIWLQTLTNTLDNILNPITKNYLITHAPQAPYFMGRTLNQYPQGGYLTIHNNVGNKIDWYNIQFYNQGSTTYNSYSNMFQSSVGWSSNSAVYQMINANNPEQISIPANKIVVGKHSLGDGSDFVDGNTLKNIFNQALATNSPVWNTGFMCWQFYTENNQYPKFQVINEVVNANWDPTATFPPTPPPVPTPAPIPTTANPTTNGGGSGCVNGNICIKVKAFAAIPSQSTPVWWWSIYDENIINSLTPGCIITDCTAIEIKQSNTNEWIRAGNKNGYCVILMVNNPFRSTIISIDFRITTTNNNVIISNGVVQDATANKEWDLGSNFVFCTAVPNGTKIPTQRPSNRTSVAPTTSGSKYQSNSPNGCYATGAWEGDTAMDNWCVINCAARNCPSTHCLCTQTTKIPSISDMTCNSIIDWNYEWKRIQTWNEYSMGNTYKSIAEEEFLLEYKQCGNYNEHILEYYYYFHRTNSNELKIFMHICCGEYKSFGCCYNIPNNYNKIYTPNQAIINHNPNGNYSHIIVTQNTHKKSFVFGIKQYVIIGILCLIIICVSCAIIRIIKYYCDNKHKTILSSNANKTQIESVNLIKMHDLHSIPSVTNTNKSSDGSTSFMTHTDSADLSTMEQPHESVIVTPKQNIDI